MGFARLALLAALTWAPLAAAKIPLYELRGKVEPPPGRAVVAISSAASPFNLRTIINLKGEFRFKRLEAGPYKVYVFAPGAGEVEQTVAVGPSTADKKRRVRVTIPFDSPDIRALQEQHTASVRELSIPAPAKLDFVEARRRLGKRDVEGAIRSLESAVKRAPEFVAAWNELGTIAYQSKRYEDAERYFRKAFELDPAGFAPAVNLGGVLLNLGRPTEALKYNTYALGLRPHDALANAQMGINYFLLGELDRAIPFLKEAKRRDPAHFSHPQLTLADIYLRRGDVQAAVAELRDFLARHPDAERAPKVREQLRSLGAE
jgi:tetratricopeptide (TPR) repeat protein